MPSRPHVRIPKEIAYQLWQASLERAWKLYGQAIPRPLQLPQIPYRDAIGFGDALGVATTDDEALQAIKSHPQAAGTFLLFATKLDEHYEKHPEQMFEMSVSERGREIPPFQILASTTMDTMQRVIERDEQPPLSK
jgi:hypothetical protein